MGTRFEVLNLGIPHASSDHLLSLLLSEGLALEPDFVTLYAGANDSAVKEEVTGVARRLWRAIRGRLLLAEFTGHLAERLTPPSMHSWSDAYAAHRGVTFLENVRAMAQACEARGTRFIAMSQQTKSLAIPAETLAGVKYAEEVRTVREQAARGTLAHRWSMDVWVAARDRVDELPTGHGRAARTLLADLDKTRIFLIHARLMDGLRDLARNTPGMGFVDGIAVLDDRRDLLTSWVHSTPMRTGSSPGPWRRRSSRRRRCARGTGSGAPPRANPPPEASRRLAVRAAGLRPALTRQARLRRQYAPRRESVGCILAARRPPRAGPDHGDRRPLRNEAAGRRRRRRRQARAP